VIPHVEAWRQLISMNCVKLRGENAIDVHADHPVRFGDPSALGRRVSGQPARCANESSPT
jgi:hypothetical protein